MSGRAGGLPTLSGYAVALTLLACSRLVAGLASLRIPVMGGAHQWTLDEQVAIQQLEHSSDPQV
jgi:hypothetical protein